MVIILFSPFSSIVACEWAGTPLMSLDVVGTVNFKVTKRIRITLMLSPPSVVQETEGVHASVPGGIQLYDALWRCWCGVSSFFLGFFPSFFLGYYSLLYAKLGWE